MLTRPAKIGQNRDPTWPDSTRPDPRVHPTRGQLWGKYRGRHSNGLTNKKRNKRTNERTNERTNDIIIQRRLSVRDLNLSTYYCLADYNKPGRRFINMVRLQNSHSHMQHLQKFGICIPARKNSILLFTVVLHCRCGRYRWCHLVCIVLDAPSSDHAWTIATASCMVLQQEIWRSSRLCRML